MSMTSGVRRFFENIPIRVLHSAVLPGTKTDLAWINMARENRIAFQIILPALAADGEVRMVVRQAKTSVGGDAKDLELGGVTAQIPVTALVGTGTTPVWAVIEVDTEKMDINNGFKFLTVAVTSTETTESNATVLAILHQAQDKPVTQEAACKAIVYFDAAV